MACCLHLESNDWRRLEIVLTLGRVVSRRPRFTRNLGRRLPRPTPPGGAQGYMRFEHATERFGGIAFGPFSYIADARKVLFGADRTELDAIAQWFENHLEAPERMVPFRDVGRRRARRRKHEGLAQCWFCEDAREHVAKARELVAVLGRAGFTFLERRAGRLPGKLCAEDGLQIAVVAYRDTRTAFKS